jgi:hypothetical protein
MELAPVDNDDWGEVHFIDLNRGRIRDQLTTKERALDFARLDIPSGFLEILVQIYWQGEAPSSFLREMKKARRQFVWWQASRRFRCPAPK